MNNNFVHEFHELTRKEIHENLWTKVDFPFYRFFILLASVGATLAVAQRIKGNREGLLGLFGCKPSGLFQPDYKSTIWNAPYAYRLKKIVEPKNLCGELRKKVLLLCR
jgi:hypothetical protein